jgi:hypothetical protein
VQKSRTIWSTPLRQNRWFSLMLEVHYSESRTVGYVQVWYDGKLQKLANGRDIHHGQTWDGAENNIHWGVCRRASHTGPQIHDLWRPRIATTMAEANPV